MKKPSSKDELILKFKALSDPSRFMIVEFLARDKNLCVSDLAEKVNISVAGISQHIKVLEEAGLVKPERRGKRICYQIVDSKPNQIFFNLIKKRGVNE